MGMERKIRTITRLIHKMDIVFDMKNKSLKYEVFMNVIMKKISPK